MLCGPRVRDRAAGSTIADEVAASWVGLAQADVNQWSCLRTHPANAIKAMG